MEVEAPGRRRTPDAALLLALTRMRPARSREGLKATFLQLDAIKSQRIEGRLAILLDECGAMTWNLKPVKELTFRIILP